MFTIGVDEVTTAILELLGNVQKSLYTRAESIFHSHQKLVTEWFEFPSALLHDEYTCTIPHCLSDECEGRILEELSTADGINSG
jgi:hypothetical protein